MPSIKNEKTNRYRYRYSTFVNILDIQVQFGPYANFSSLNKMKDRFLLAMYYEDDAQMDSLISSNKTRIFYKYPQDFK